MKMRYILLLMALLAAGCATMGPDGYRPVRLAGGVPHWPRFECRNAHLVDVLSVLQSEANALLPDEKHIGFILWAYVYQADRQFEISLEDYMAKRFEPESYWGGVESCPRFFCTTDLREVTIDQVIDSLKNQAGYFWSSSNNTYTIQLREHW